MSTPCSISIANKDKSYDTIYCHWDGYYENAGKILNTSYTTEQKVRELIALGDLSILGNKIAPTSTVHTLDNHEKDVCLFYGRDVGEKHTEPEHHKNKANLNDSYNYLFQDNIWYCRRGRGKWKPLQKTLDSLK